MELVTVKATVDSSFSELSSAIFCECTPSQSRDILNLLEALESLKSLQAYVHKYDVMVCVI